MKTFADFLAAAKIEGAASREKYDADARQPLDAALRLGSVAGPLVCTSCSGRIPTFEELQGTPFDWGKVRPDDEVHAVLQGTIILANDKQPIGTLSLEHSSMKLTPNFGSFKINPNAICVFPPKHFDATFRTIPILKKCTPEAPWPAKPPSEPAVGQPPPATAEDRAFAACLEDANTVLAIKGPPGTGKTELLAKVALGLATNGKKVGIVTVSHAAVNNALKRVADLSKNAGKSPKIQKHGDKGDVIPGVILQKLNANPASIWGAVIHAATWFYLGKNPDISLKFKHGTCDVLLIDEAGQVPVYEAAALSHLAPRMILFGDEDQLPNIYQGQHPPGSHGDSSAMRYLRDVLPAWAIPLEVSHRMNRDICGLIQRYFYPDIALQPGKNADAHLIENGIRFPSLIKDDFPHLHPRLSRSEKEAERVVEWVRRLLTMQAVVEGEPARAMTTDDIAVLTPFRAHAAAIKTALAKAGIPDLDKLRLGTVDKMQGQGAAAVIYSLASSSKDYIAGQTEWLLSSNRWNVAISRAMACAIVVGDLNAHFAAIPKALKGIAAQSKIRRVMEDGAWSSPTPEDGRSTSTAPATASSTSAPPPATDVPDAHACLPATHPLPATGKTTIKLGGERQFRINYLPAKQIIYLSCKTKLRSGIWRGGKDLALPAEHWTAFVNALKLCAMGPPGNPTSGPFAVCLDGDGMAIQLNHPNVPGSKGKPAIQLSKAEAERLAQTFQGSAIPEH